MRIRAVIVLACCALVAGCAMAPPSPLTLQSARQLRLETVLVTVDPNAAVSWANAEHEFVVAQRSLPGQTRPAPQVSTSLNDPQTADSDAARALIDTPEGKAYVHGRIVERMTAALDSELKPAMQHGDRNARLEVTVHEFIIPGAIQRAVIGGAPVMLASAVLRDASTGEVIAERAKMVAVAPAGNGWVVLLDQMFDDLDVRVVRAYARQYRDWLIPKNV